MEAASRIFSVAEFIRPSDAGPVRSAVLVTEESAVVCRVLSGGQRSRPS